MKTILTVLTSAFLIVAGFFATSCTMDSVACQGYANRHSCDSRIIRKDVKLGAFDEIDATMVNVYVTVGKATGVARIEAPEKIMKYVKVTTGGGKLRAYIDYPKNYSNRCGDKVDVYVTTPSVTDIEARLSSCVKVKGRLSAGSFEASTSTSASIDIPYLKVSGYCDLETSTSGDITIGTLDASKLKANASTSGSINVNGGNASKVTLDASTSADIDCRRLKATVGKATASTSGSISCSVANLRSSKSTGGSIKNSSR